MISTLVIALALCADPKPAGKNDTMKNLLKDAITQPSAGGADASTAKPADTHPDTTKMPFTPDSIKQVVLSYQPQIQGCYEEHLAVKEKAIEGNLKTAFVITGDGLVKSAKVEKKGSSLKDPKLHECVVAVLSAMTFPKPPDGKDHPIEFPFNLKAIR